MKPLLTLTMFKHLWAQTFDTLNVGDDGELAGGTLNVNDMVFSVRSLVSVTDAGFAIDPEDDVLKPVVDVTLDADRVGK